MINFLLIIFTAECLLILGWGMKKHDRIYQFPFLAAAVFSGWVLPQLLGLSQRPDAFPDGALEKTLIVTILCLAMCSWGYVSDKSPQPLQRLNWFYDDTRLLKSAFILSLTGAFFFWEISSFSESAIDAMGGQWTGIVTVYAFFAKLVGYGFAIALICLFRSYSKLALAIVLFDSSFYLRNIFIGGRRGPTVEFICMIVIVLWFYRGILIPRWLMLVGILCGALMVNSIGNYRAATGAKELPTWEEVSQIDFLGNLREIYKGSEGNEELKNAVYNISAADQTMNFDYGLALWNALVFQYVPAQFLGREFKEGIMADFPDNANKLYGHTPWPGTTITGMSDSFKSFWYVGVFLFFLIGLIFSKLYRAGINGNITAQVLLIVMITSGLHSITHGVYWFFSGFPHVFVFIMPALYYSVIKSQNSPAYFR